MGDDGLLAEIVFDCTTAVAAGAAFAAIEVVDLGDFRSSAADRSFRLAGSAVEVMDGAYGLTPRDRMALLVRADIARRVRWPLQHETPR